MKLIRLLFITTLCLFSTVQADDLVDLIYSGKLDQARDSLSRVSTAASRDGDILFCRGLLQSDGVEAARMFEGALNASASLSQQEDAYFYLRNITTLTVIWLLW